MKLLKLLSCVFLCVLLIACGSMRSSFHLDEANEAYSMGNCDAVFISLSSAERIIATRKYFQPELAMLRGLCLENKGNYFDAIAIYNYIQDAFPNNEYAYRAKARGKVLMLQKVESKRPL